MYLPHDGDGGSRICGCLTAPLGISTTFCLVIHGLETILECDAVPDNYSIIFASVKKPCSELLTMLSQLLMSQQQLADNIYLQ